jgi:hypothetical protein
VTAPDQRPPLHERLRIDSGWLVEDVGEHTCAGGTPESGYAHEPSCGLEPLMRLDELDAIMRARSRFAVRILPTGDHEECVAVELWAGERYDPTARHNRRRQGVVELPRAHADDLLLLLGEPYPDELPEDERPADEWEGLL